jgi:multiple sugar transport system permease protein
MPWVRESRPTADFTGIRYTKEKFSVPAQKARKTYTTGVTFFVAPAVLVLLVVGIAPLFFAAGVSFHEFLLPKVHWHGNFLGIWPIYDAPFCWFDNYISIFQDDSFRDALFRTFLFLIINLPCELVLGLLIALLLHAPGNELLKKICRVALVVPMATTFAVVGLTGRLLFDGNYGILNYVWSLIFHTRPDWLADPNLAFLAISVMEIWQWTPFCALVLFSSLTMVPTEIEEAAKLETAHWWQVLWRVQLPFLLPGITAILILRTADILKLFDVVYIMTKGGPGSATELISLFVQRIGFRAFDQGVASAQAIVLLIIAILLSRFYIKFFYREV